MSGSGTYGDKGNWMSFQTDVNVYLMVSPVLKTPPNEHVNTLNIVFVFMLQGNEMYDIRKSGYYHKYFT